MPKKKHPREMTNDEAIKHLFHPKIVKHVKAEIAKVNAPKASKWRGSSIASKTSGITFRSRHWLRE